VAELSRWIGRRHGVVREFIQKGQKFAKGRLVWIEPLVLVRMTTADAEVVGRLGEDWRRFGLPTVLPPGGVKSLPLPAAAVIMLFEDTAG
jgi:hypothetical protein